MKKLNPKLISSLLLLLLVGLIRARPAAAEVVNSDATTSVGVSVVSSPLKLRKVTMPNFGKHHLTGQTQILTSLTDLEINVDDQRINQTNPWVLQYELSAFNDQDKTLGQNVLLTLGKGQLTASTEPVNYLSMAQQLYPSQEKRLVTTRDVQRNYRYTIPANEITLTVPGNIQAGNYSAKQTVTLFDIAEAN